MKASKKLLTLPQWKKKNKVRQKEIYKILYSNNLYQDLDLFIKELSLLQENNKHMKSILVGIDCSNSYGDHYPALKIAGVVLETTNEFDDRVKKEYDNYLFCEKRLLKEYKELKKKFGD